jgi:hypothetical protein
MKCQCFKDICNAIGLRDLAIIINEYVHEVPPQIAFNCMDDYGIAMTDSRSQIGHYYELIRTANGYASNMITFIFILAVMSRKYIMIEITHYPNGFSRGKWSNTQTIYPIDAYNHGKQDIRNFMLDCNGKPVVNIDDLPTHSREHICQALRKLNENIDAIHRATK